MSRPILKFSSEAKKEQEREAQMPSGVALAGQVRVRVLTALILLAFIACALCSSTCECDTPQVRAVLIRFFYSNGGLGWRNARGWASYDPVCSWYGIRCNGTDLTDIDLDANRLKGTLPAEFANITSIQRIDLSLNSWLYGPLPPEWSAMTQLAGLRLRMNSLNGTLPPEWSTMSHIRMLFLDNNNINGTLPPEWGAMPKLEQLDLSGNQISGSLPSQWGKMAQIRDIRLNSNILTGPLPSEWSNMAQLDTLSLYGNSLSGPLAPCLFPLWNASFIIMNDGVFNYNDFEFNFSNNKFSGRLRLPCLSIDPCSRSFYRKRLNELLLDGNQLCIDCFVQCQCAKTENTTIESPNLAILRVSNSSECCSACVKHPMCVAAVYHYDDNRCELKNVTSPTFRMPNADVLLPS